MKVYCYVVWVLKLMRYYDNDVKWKMWWYEEDFESNMKLINIQWIYLFIYVTITHNTYALYNVVPEIETI